MAVIRRAKDTAKAKGRQLVLPLVVLGLLFLASLPVVSAAAPLPVVIWHGMGDTCCWAFSMGAVKDRIQSVLGTFVLSIKIGASLKEDELAGFFGDVNKQVESACEQIAAQEELAGGYNAIGFSQGGQFLRAVLERCQHRAGQPKMRALVTMGGQHQGIMSPPHCINPSFNATPSVLCREVSTLLGKGAYLPGVRDHVVQAQYFKDPYNLKEYLASNPFLPDINNEVPSADAAQHKANFLSLERLVLYKFDLDSMVVPRESSWFGFYDGTRLVPYNETQLYQDDLIGLAALDRQGKVVFGTVPEAEHMQFSLDWLEDYVVMPYLSGVQMKSSN